MLERLQYFVMGVDNKLPSPGHDDLLLCHKSILCSQGKLLYELLMSSFESSDISICVNFLVIEFTPVEEPISLCILVSTVIVETSLHS